MLTWTTSRKVTPALASRPGRQRRLHRQHVLCAHCRAAVTCVLTSSTPDLPAVTEPSASQWPFLTIEQGALLALAAGASIAESSSLDEADSS